MRKIFYYAEIVFGIFMLFSGIVGGGSLLIEEGFLIENIIAVLIIIAIGVGCLYNAFYVQKSKLKESSGREYQFDIKNKLSGFNLYKPKSEEEKLAIAQAKENRRKEKAILKNNNRSEKLFKKEVKELERSISKLNKDYAKELQRVEDLRWTAIGNSFKYNMTEGKVMINASDFLFSDIQGAALNVIYSERVDTITTDNTVSKSKKRPSIGGAIVGGALFGPLGVAAGGVGLAKTKTKGGGQFVTTSNTIPTCSHIGVKVKVKNFEIEIPILSTSVDQGGLTFTKKIGEANQIVSTLLKLSGEKVPDSYLPVVQEPSVVEIQNNINSMNEQLENKKQAGPTYENIEKYNG